MFPTEDIARFESKYTRGEPDQCWQWNGTLQKRFGFPDERLYGVIQMDRKPIGPHRVAYMLAHGPIPTGHVIRHACDNPRCVNPAHLSTGTPADNGADAKGKPKPRVSPQLTYPDAVRIRIMFAYRDPRLTIAAWCAIVAEHMGVRRSITIYAVVRNIRHTAFNSKSTFRTGRMSFIAPGYFQD